MPILAAARIVRRPSRDAIPSDEHLPHWSEVTPSRRAHEEPRRLRPTPTVASALADLVSWAGDLGILLTRKCTEDRAAIEEVRRYALAWLAGEPCDDVRIEDVLNSVATLLSAIDLTLERDTSNTVPCDQPALAA